jgi:hypothetical protein
MLTKRCAKAGAEYGEQARRLHEGQTESGQKSHGSATGFAWHVILFPEHCVQSIRLDLKHPDTCESGLCSLT